MSYFESMNWETIKRDLQKGLERGMGGIRKGAIVAQKKAGELTEEGKRQYKIFTLKSKVHKGISDLGVRVYGLMGTRMKNPALDAKVRDIVSQLKKLEAQIRTLEKPEKSAGRKKAASKAK